MLELYKSEFLKYLDARVEIKEPKNLYEPIAYILSLGGKKLRPILALMAADAFGDNYKKAMDVALAVEVFHNFTLIHDDIMDDAPLRRGSKTVHEKWNSNIGILSGDAMLIQSYQILESYDSDTFKKLLTIFSKTAIEVCEGQQLDVDFETRKDVSINEYLKMIRQKTSVLVAASLKMGAVVVGADEIEAQKLYDFGLNLGIAFQLQDDYLDTFGDPNTFGKQVGGDIIENKKTFLYLKAIDLGSKNEKETLEFLFDKKLIDNKEKIETVRTIFNDSGALSQTKFAIKKYTDKAFELLDEIDISDEKKVLLRRFGENLMTRTV
ncbi:polyprenyl synthetase family protein [Urechidicola croceus]|uniref:Polyprenyl synthetase n=1 Tax=Urechidicola croceus TaxID=1850246 RepID=A0A1D8PA72_9FLAO|nr:polyprenyl synthetase family protein [Urechidicola croceus]AOW21441.1 polyprenyl synthetase [Urechidicola croceus]